MPYIYKMADLIINTSTYEGFGLPLLEALSLQKTMLCSDIPVYREIGKDAVLYFRNNSIDDLTDKLQGYFTGKYNDIPVNEMKSRADFFNQKNYGIVFLEMFKGSQS